MITLSRPPRPRPLRILVVDDEVQIRQCIERFLRLDIACLELAQASDAETALRMVALEDWDVILLDVTLPKKSGLEALRIIRARHDYVPIIIMSAYPEFYHQDAAIAAGASAYLEKTRLPEQLFAMVQSLIPKDRLLPAAA